MPTEEPKTEKPEGARTETQKPTDSYPVFDAHQTCLSAWETLRKMSATAIDTLESKLPSKDAFHESKMRFDRCTAQHGAHENCHCLIDYKLRGNRGSPVERRGGILDMLKNLHDCLEDACYILERKRLPYEDQFTSEVELEATGYFENEGDEKKEDYSSSDKEEWPLSENEDYEDLSAYSRPTPNPASRRVRESLQGALEEPAHDETP
ncbi:hypothetical protein K458DRAFT_402436 [Lentithecium fluviatile CBS 122367]|uniref:Uncharacterized protein n=1 Tax=Lentithecium fluviatile CBS 122367 TaxID=1168545 RepID=A0A6G1J9T6_9PLEO|nr:hypothetical protein K458DRAFT_402436 [Lentithecium fluviatile CBS 122367]